MVETTEEPLRHKNNNSAVFGEGAPESLGIPDFMIQLTLIGGSNGI
jgi:hypothetical protein